MSKCLQCSNEATTTILITGFDLYGKAKTTAVSNRCQTCVNRINDFMKRDYSERMREAREEIEKEKQRKAEEKLKREEQERKRKQRDKNKTCCRVCGNSSFFNHLVINTLTKKVEEQSTIWKVNPDYEIIVCNQTCLKKWYDKTFSFSCPKCGKTGTDSVVKNKVRFCSQKCSNDYYSKYNFTCSECQENKEHDEIWTLTGSENQGKKFCSKFCAQEYQHPKCDDCGEKCYSTSYYKDVDSKTGTLCINCHILQKNSSPKTTVPKPETKKSIPPPSSPSMENDNDSSSSNSSNNTEKCDKCGLSVAEYYQVA